MFLRTLLEALLAFTVLVPAVRAVINTQGTFKEDVLCELRDGVLGKQCGAESCSSQGNCKPKCCALTEPQPPLDPAHGQRSRKACSEYVPKNNAECGYVSNKESIEAKIEEFPYLVALGYKVKDNDTEHKWLCAGGLISENFVLTTATCITEARKGPELVLLGSVQPKNDARAAAASHTQKIRIAATIVHPEWPTTKQQRNNDIALVQLANAVRFSNSVRPACLFTGRHPPLERATVAGFGQSAVAGPSGNKVIKADVPIIRKDQCHNIFSNIGKGEINDSTMICAGEKGKDTCLGDSGAPLVIKFAQPLCSYQILGVTSFGTLPCGSGSPGVYTRVYSYLPWIESIVWP